MVKSAFQLLDLLSNVLGLNVGKYDTFFFFFLFSQKHKHF